MCDETIREYRYGAFTGGSPDLPARLRAHGLHTVLLTIANACCESGARDAMMLNFRTVLVPAFYLQSGDVPTGDECIAGLATEERVAA
jgi:ureidoacrylate peracid hydrolase